MTAENNSVYLDLICLPSLICFLVSCHSHCLASNLLFLTTVALCRHFWTASCVVVCLPLFVVQQWWWITWSKGFFKTAALLVKGSLLPFCMKFVLNPLLVVRFRINTVKAYGGSLLGLLSERDQCVPVSYILIPFFLSFNNSASLSIVDCNREPSQDCQRLLLFRGLSVAAGEEESLTSGVVFHFSLQP